MLPLQPYGPLAAIIGDKPLPRTEVTSRVWAYIKKNRLQDRRNARMINSDAKLRDLSRQDQFDMFELTRLINRYLRHVDDTSSPAADSSDDELRAADEEPTADPDELDLRVRRLRKRAVETQPPGSKQPVRVETTTSAYVRDPAVKAWVLENANGKCELCLQPAPFTDAQGFPFLEVHHVTMLADGGADTISNAAALCPNCHRRLHFANDCTAAAATLRRRLQRLR